MAFLDEQGLQHLVDKINVRSSKTLPDNAPDGTIIIDPDECSKEFNVSMDVDTALSATSTNPVQNKAVKTVLDNKHDKNANVLVGIADYRSLGFNDKYCLQFDANTIGQNPVGMKVIINGNDTGRLVGENAFTNDNYAFTGASDYGDGEAGLVPAPTVDEYDYFLKGDGSWAEIPQPTVTVDAELSSTSTNPVQNKVIKTNMDALFTKIKGSLDMISSDIPTKVSELENDAGYLTQHQSLDDYAKKNTANTYGEPQTFEKAVCKEVLIVKEVYGVSYTGGGAITLATNVVHHVANSEVTLDMAQAIADFLSVNTTSTVFSIYITPIDDSAAYPLIITNAGTLKYVGSASDFAITSAGLLLNIMMLKDARGNVTSIVQASKLEGGA